jgi:putative membrane protein
MKFSSIALLACSLTLMAATTVSKTDKQFLMTAAKTDMVEAHEGQMAASQAARPDIKDFANTLVADHTESYERLTELASKSGVKIPTGINSAKEPDLAPLAHLKGSSFDRAFARNEVAEHKRVVAEYKREAEHGQDPDIKAWAAARIPVVEKHLQLAEACAK